MVTCCTSSTRNTRSSLRMMTVDFSSLGKLVLGRLCEIVQERLSPAAAQMQIR